MRAMIMIVVALTVPAGAAAGGHAKETVMELKSAAFESGGDIPKPFACEGEDVSPPLSWSGAPAGTKSFALIMDDPDAPDPAAPKVTWVHWVLYNVPADSSSLGQNASAAGLPPGAREGLNDWKKPGYRGPCPPVGRHRYHFKLYALDTVLPDLKNPTKADLEKAMKGHVLAQTEIIGGYRKSG